MMLEEIEAIEDPVQRAKRARKAKEAYETVFEQLKDAFYALDEVKGAVTLAGEDSPILERAARKADDAIASIDDVLARLGDEVGELDRIRTRALDEQDGDV